MIPGLARPPPIPAPPQSSNPSSRSSSTSNLQAQSQINPDDELAALARALESAEQSGV